MNVLSRNYSYTALQPTDQEAMSCQDTDGLQFQEKEGQLRNFDIKILDPLNQFIKQYIWEMKERF